MKKLFLLIIVVGMSVFLSGCNKSGSDLFTQALKSDIPKNKNDARIVSKAPVKTKMTEDYGEVLTTKKGMVLYTKFDDAVDSSTCYGDCAIAWPPFIVDYADDVSGDYGTLERTDGSLQVTRLGKPLYSYTPDGIGQVTGDGYKGIWSVVIVGK